MRVPQPGFFDLSRRMSDLSRHGDPLESLQASVDWEAFRPVLAKALRKSAPPKSAAGRKPYDPVLMLKVLVLQHLYNLSDHEIQRQILDRLSFMRFLGLGLHDAVPDEKTVWLFRETLGPEGVRRLFGRFGAMLEAKGLSAKQGQMVDAAIIERPRQRGLSCNENIRAELAQSEAEGPSAPGTSEAASRRQRDLDAEHGAKHGRSHYGYKTHVSMDRKHKLVRTYEVTPASVHDGTMLEAVLDARNTGPGVWADSAYRSAENEALLEERGLVSRVLHRAWRGHPLTAAQEAANRVWAVVRARVEHGFAGFFQMLAGKRIRCVGIARAEARIGLTHLIYNMRRMAFLTGAKSA
jgi:IS5 family transposase